MITENAHDDWDAEDAIVDPDQDQIPHIVMQFKKAIDVNGSYPILFKDGTKTLMPLPIIYQFMRKYSSLKPYQREEMQDLAAKSKDALLQAIETY